LIRDFKFDKRRKRKTHFPYPSGRNIIALVFVVFTSIFAFALFDNPTEETIAPLPELDVTKDVEEIPEDTRTISRLILPNSRNKEPVPTSVKSISLNIDDGQSVKPITAAQLQKLKPINNQDKWITHKIKSGESLALIFQKYKLGSRLLYNITHSSKTAKKLALIRPGETLNFLFNKESNEFKKLVLQKDPVFSLIITRKGDTFTAIEKQRKLEVKTSTASVTIQSSLFLDGQAAGMSDGQIMAMASLFAWDIDFALELRKGDSFRLIYEENYLDGKKYSDGPILAAEFINQGNKHQAIRYQGKSKFANYYDTEGRSKRRAFIRTPVKFSRISSKFTRNRWHPVLKKWRSHKGVDYAAPRGTPVKATSNGKVIHRGRKGGYGNAVFIRHGGKYTTVYGHLSKFNRHVKKGSTVKQGQIIGYVGSTGLATGPHLHYELRVFGVHKNPLTVKLPKSNPLPKKQLKNFRTKSKPLLDRLQKLNQTDV